MGALKKCVHFVDFLSEKSGQIGKWAAVGLVLVGSYDTILRHFFNAPTNWAYDMMCMLGGTLYLLGASYDLRYDAHTRVDVFFNMLSPRARALVNVIASLVFFFPLFLMMLYLGIVWAIKAVKVHEVMFTSFWYPPAWPYRTVFAVGIFLLLLQGVVNLVKNIYFLKRGGEID
jgi:TRAP-type mannitol/chloroaromatic compound transport system permease small subunit